jgi:hypothetical protein
MTARLLGHDLEKLGQHRVPLGIIGHDPTEARLVVKSSGQGLGERR